MFSVIRWFMLLRSGKINFSPVINSYNSIYLAESSATSSSGAAGRVSSLYGSQFLANQRRKNSLSIFSGSCPPAILSLYESLIQNLLESGV